MRAHWLTFSVLMSALLASSISAQEQVASARLRPVWSHERSGEVADNAMSPSGRCVAIALTDAVAILGTDGAELWRWAFRAENRFIRASAVAVSPSCDFIAIVGDAGYRYAWIVHRKGRRVPLAMKPTPLSVAISHDGALVAVGTSARNVRMYTRDGIFRWRADLEAGCCVRRLAFAENDRELFVTDGAASVLSVAGDVKWSHWQWGMWAAPGGRMFITHWEPPHGPGIPYFIVTNDRGIRLWSRFGRSPVATRTGEFVFAYVNDNQNPTEQDAFGDQPGKLTLMDRSGNTLATWPGGGEPLGAFDDGGLVLVRRFERLEALDRRGAPVWNIPTKDYPRVTLIPQSNAVLVSSGDSVTWFAVK